MQPPQSQYTTFVVLREEVIRRGLVSMLRELPEISEVRASRNVSEAVTSLNPCAYDVVILGSEATEDLLLETSLSLRRHTKLLILLHDISDSILATSSRLRADGFLMASGLTTQCLTSALKNLQHGEMYLPAELTRRMMTRFQRSSLIEPPPVSLTPREGQALSLLVEGLSNKQIASQLGISQHSAKRYVANVLAKLNCPNRTLAAAYAVRFGLVNDNGAKPIGGNLGTLRAKPFREELTWGSS
jgi:two-component system nitrate/nitrite response regulator NarL